MAVPGFSIELACSVSAARMFKASVLDLHNLAPKIIPELVSGAELLQGDGGVGSIKQYTFTDAVPYGFVKERVDLVDKEGLEYKYTVTEGADVGTKISSAVYHTKFILSGDGGCVVKLSAHVTPAAGVEFTEEDANAGKEGLVGMFKAVEAHLLQNPDAYA